MLYCVNIQSNILDFNIVQVFFFFFFGNEMSIIKYGTGFRPCLGHNFWKFQYYPARHKTSELANDGPIQAQVIWARSRAGLTSHNYLKTDLKVKTAFRWRQNLFSAMGHIPYLIGDRSVLAFHFSFLFDE